MTDGFQPRWRSPAPPLDLVQDFVNTEIPDWDRDDIATPEALGRVARGPRAARAATTVDAETRSSRRGRCAPRSATSRSRTRSASAARRSRERGDRRDARAIPARGAPRRRGARARTRAATAAGAGSRRSWRRRRGAASRRLGADEGLPPGDLRLALLRRLAQPLVELVLDADLRRPREGARLPPARHRECLRGRCGAPGTWSASRSAASGAATEARSSRRSASPPPRPCSPGSSRERPWRRTAASRRTSSASRPPPAPCAPCGSACPRGGRSAGARSTGARARRCRPPRRRADRGRARPREHRRRPVRRPRGRRRPRAARPAPGSGRLPRACTAERCEVSSGSAAQARCPTCRGSRSSRSARRCSARASCSATSSRRPTTRSRTRRSRPALRDASQYHRPPPAPLVVAEGVDALVSSPVLARSYRSYAWVQRSAPARRGSGRSTVLVAGPTPPAPALEAQSPSWALTLPAEELREAERVATVAGRRLLLVGGEAAALLVAFAVLAAGALRRDLAAARRRLTWHGARRWQGALLTGTECAAVGFGGALAGWLVGGAEAPSRPPRRTRPWERCSRRASSRRPGCSSGSRRPSSPPP